MAAENQSIDDTGTLPSRYVHRIIEVAEEFGIDVEPFLQGHAIDQAYLADKKNTITSEIYLAAIGAIVARSKDPDIGLLVGERTTVSDHGVLGYAVLASATLRKGIERFSKYQQILGPLVRVALSIKSGQAVIKGEEAVPLGAKYRFAVSSWVGETSHYRSLFDDSKFKFSLLRLTFPANGAKSRYEDFMGCEVLFNQKVNEIHFPEHYLDAPFSLADSSVAELCVLQCERILGRLDKKTVLVDKVRRAVMAKPGQIPTIDDVAEQVNMSSRSLRRHLGLASTSFTNIVNDVRMNLAAEYLLNTHLPPKEIGYLVGYSEVAGFHRAFRRHFNKTPGSYRNSPFEVND